MRAALMAPARVLWGLAKIAWTVVSNVVLFALAVFPGLPLLGLLHLLNALHVHGGGKPIVWCWATLHDWGDWDHSEWSSRRVCHGCGRVHVDNHGYGY